MGDMPTKRKPLSKRLRFEIFKRDNFTCQYCGATPPRVILHVDHIVPLARGGGDGAENLVTSCRDCNSGKSAVPLSSVPKSLKDTASDEAERAAQVRAYAEQIKAAREDFEALVWEIAEILEPGASKGLSVDKFGGVERFIKELGFAAVFDAANMARTTASRSPFKYFCKVCWRLVKDGAEA